MNYEQMYKILFSAISDTIDLLIEDVINKSDDTQIVMPQAIYKAIEILRAASLKTEEMYIDAGN